MLKYLGFLGCFEVPSAQLRCLLTALGQLDRWQARAEKEERGGAVGVLRFGWWVMIEQMMSQTQKGVNF